MRKLILNKKIIFILDYEHDISFILSIFIAFISMYDHTNIIYQKLHSILIMRGGGFRGGSSPATGRGGGPSSFGARGK